MGVQSASSIITLADVAPGPSALELSAIAGNFGFLLLALVAIAWLVYFQRRRIAVEKASRAAAETNHKREAFHFEQGQLINQTGLKKMQLETQLLQTQVKIAEHELASRLRNDQVNAVAIEKLRLEVESMKLHIREQHKRLDEFGSGFE